MIDTPGGTINCLLSSAYYLLLNLRAFLFGDQVSFKELLLVRREGGTPLFGKIVVNYNGGALYTEPPFLPGFVIHRKRLVSDVGYPAADLYLVLKEQLILKIIIRMSYNEGKGLYFNNEIGDKNSDEWIPGGFKPMGQCRVVDVPEAVRIADPGFYDGAGNAVAPGAKFRSRPIPIPC